MMNNFPLFSNAVHARFEHLQTLGGELFVVDTFDLFEAYLASFPEGTNPIFRERTEHDCSCCKNFIRNIGNVVAIVDGQILTVWDVIDVPYPYDVVAKALADRIRQSPIRSVWRTKERQYGNEFTNELIQEEGKEATVRRWDHFWGKTPTKQFSLTPDKARGDLNTTAHVLQRGLQEITTDALDTVIDLVVAGNLYRGEEFLPAIKGFRALKATYDASDDKNLIVWSHLDDRSARFRNTATGTLLTDLSEGKELEWAVKSYESKVAPTNYKRPTALVTPKMIETALATLDGLGLRSAATERRHARIEDVSVNDVIFVDNSVQSKMKDSLADLLMTGAKIPTAKIDNPTPISAEEFFAKSHTSISALVENRHAPNFASITYGEAGLFKWDNGFSWAYDGDVADSTLRQKVALAGGRVDGVLRFSHMWNDVGRNASLMDLHVFMPGSSAHPNTPSDRYPEGQRVGWNKRKDFQSGGSQDVDYTAQAPEGYVPVENITFPDMAKLRDGRYDFKIHNWHCRAPTTSGFKAEIEFGGQVFQYDHPAPMKHKEWVHLATATLKNGVFTIEHHHPTTTASRERWGIQTETLVPVDTLLLSPNHWGDRQVGNRHWFFILRGAQNPDPVRGIFNEYLRADLDEHRKVFELLGSKTKAPFDPAQLSGLGFSSTQRNTLTVVADGRAYEIQF